MRFETICVFCTFVITFSRFFFTQSSISQLRTFSPPFPDSLFGHLLSLPALHLQFSPHDHSNQLLSGFLFNTYNTYSILLFQDRERIMNEALEVRARGFSTSASTLPLKSMSAMHMPSVGAAPMPRTASTPGLFAGSQMVPAAIYEDGYLQPLSSRQNIADAAAKDEPSSAGNTYATIESGTEVTTQQKDPLMTKSPRKRRSRENLLRIRAAKQEPSSDSSQYGEIPATVGPTEPTQTSTFVGRAVPQRQPSNSSLTQSERALPSPPRSPPEVRRSNLTQRTMSETSSLWEVTPRGSMMSFMKVMRKDEF